MTTNSKFNRKVMSTVLIFVLFLGTAISIDAASFGNRLNGASSYESWQVRYTGSAWNYRGSGYKWASFKYTRNGRTLMYKKVYNGKVTGSVWDDLFTWGSKGRTYFSWNRGK